jgi:hypothetical protein
MNVVFAWQSGHRPIQRATTYGLDGAFPTQLQPALLRAYEWASTRWHEFLHQPSKVMPPSRQFMSAKRLPAPGDSSQPLLSPHVQSRFGVKLTELPNELASTSAARRRPLSWPDEDMTDAEDDRPTKRRLLPRKQKQPEHAGTRLPQRHISISSDDDRPDFGRCMPAKRIESIAEYRGFDQEYADECGFENDASVPGAQHLISHPADIIVQVEAWQDGVGGNPSLMARATLPSTGMSQI